MSVYGRVIIEVPSMRGGDNSGTDFTSRCADQCCNRWA